MDIKCPYCSSDDFETFDIVGGGGRDVMELCSCYNCDGNFMVVYKFSSVEKDG